MKIISEKIAQVRDMEKELFSINEMIDRISNEMIAERPLRTSGILVVYDSKGSNGKHLGAGSFVHEPGKLLGILQDRADTLEEEIVEINDILDVAVRLFK